MQFLGVIEQRANEIMQRLATLSRETSGERSVAGAGAGAPGGGTCVVGDGVWGRCVGKGWLGKLSWLGGCKAWCVGLRSGGLLVGVFPCFGVLPV